MVHETIDGDGECQNWAIFATASGEWCRLPYNLDVGDEPAVWSSEGNLCRVPEEGWFWEPSANHPAELRFFSDSLDEVIEPDKCAIVPGTTHLVQFMMEWHNDAPNGEDTGDPIGHWVYNAGTRRSLRQTVPGCSGRLQDKPFWGVMAWHTTLKAAAPSMFALAACRQQGAAYLIDATRHQCLKTWMVTESANLRRKRSSPGPPCIAWSLRGEKLAIVNSSGTVIVNFASSPGEQHE